MIELLRIGNISKNFGGLKVLEGIDMIIQEREIVGLIGPNGAGKTTLFNIISGIIGPEKGTINFLGIDTTHLKPHEICRQGLSRTFQIMRPFRKLTVRENVLIGAFNRYQDVGVANKKAREVLEFVDLGAKSGLRADNLNTSELKRLELAKALATEPKLLMLDEVMAGLNLVEQERMISLIYDIRRRGTAIFVIEHSMKTIMSISDRIVVIHHGILIADGRPEEVSNNRRVIEAYFGEED